LSSSQAVKRSANPLREQHVHSRSPAASNLAKGLEVHALAVTLCRLFVGSEQPEFQMMRDPVHWSTFLDVTARILGPEQGSYAVEQYQMFQEGAGLFGTQMAKQSMTRSEPYSWWQCYGSATPQLQHLAMKVLSQPSSASSSEQSWSEYDYIHNKQRNRLQTTVARDLVYVHANIRLLNSVRSYSRYTDLIEASRQAASTEALRAELETGGWDGNCSDDDYDDNTFRMEAEDELEEMDINSFLE